MPVPAPLWYESAQSSLGREYFVMERVDGDPVHRVGQEILDRLGTALGTNLARLHGAGIPAQQGPTSSADATRAEVERWRDRYTTSRIAPIPLLGLVLAWLEKNAPESDREPVVLWGDPGLHNVLHEDGTITAMLDWELSHTGDPMEDLGAAVWSCLGMLDPDLVIEAYRAGAPGNIDQAALEYFEILACATRSVMLTNAVANYVNGSTTAPNLAGLGLQLITSNLERAVGLLGHELASEPRAVGVSLDEDVLRPATSELIRGVARFLESAIRPLVTDQRATRGLKTTAALLETAALRSEIEGPVNEARRTARDLLLAQLEQAGVPTSGGIEAIAVEIEHNEAYAALRPAVWRHLVEDLAAVRTLIRPLTALYEDP